MKSIRLGVFETNSSSCHCVTILEPEVYKALKEKTSVLHYNYINVGEGESTNVFFSSLDLISVEDLHKKFLKLMKEAEAKKDRDFINLEKYCFDEYWEGLFDAFKANINNVDFFRKVLFFDEKENDVGIRLKKLKKAEENEMNRGLRTRTPEYVMAWAVRALINETGLYFISFCRPFEDLNVSITDFIEQDDKTFKAEHGITC